MTYLNDLRRRYDQAEERLNKARALYLSPPTEFDSPDVGRMLWEDYREAWEHFLWISQLLRDRAGSKKELADPHK
jgi:hypothetical protein